MTYMLKRPKAHLSVTSTYILVILLLPFQRLQHMPLRVYAFCKNPNNAHTGYTWADKLLHTSRNFHLTCGTKESGNRTNSNNEILVYKLKHNLVFCGVKFIYHVFVGDAAFSVSRTFGNKSI